MGEWAVMCGRLLKDWRYDLSATIFISVPYLFRILFLFILMSLQPPIVLIVIVYSLA
jgi:hypothetical protein